MLRLKIPTVLLTFATLAALTASDALAAPGDEHEQKSETTTVMTGYRPYNRPPPVRRYRPAPRRVYVAPAYNPRPRRVIEVPYEPMFHFGIGINGNSVLSASGDSYSGDSIVEGLGNGGGFDIGFGWRMSDWVSLDFNWMMSFHDSGAQGNDATLSSFGLDMRFFLVDRSRRVQPYIQAGIDADILGRGFDYPSIGGLGFQLGGGADFYLTQHVSIGGKILFRPAWLSDEDQYGPATTTGSITMLTYGADLKFHF